VIRGFGAAQPRFGAEVFVADSVTVIGAVEVGDAVSLWYGAVLRGDVGTIRIGARSNVQDNASIHMTHQVSHAWIGDDVTIGHNAVVHGAVIEDAALVGMQSVVLDNARIGAGSWVAAGSVVPPNLQIPPGVLVRGSPARIVRDLREAELSWAQAAVLRYLELAQEHRRAQIALGIILP
jgi:carbonic anhydrase/acetyltransferase-like protein (isoleucine patch superfamily)